MSATHILNASSGIRCGQQIVRGFVTTLEYAKLAADNRLRTRVKSSIKHNCAYREGGECYTSQKKTSRASCVRRKETISGFCNKCVNYG